MLNPFCPFSIETETATHYFLRYHYYHAKRFALMNDLIEINSSFSILIDNNVIDLVLCSDIFDDKKNDH